jgi:ankyrin repeat protein
MISYSIVIDHSILNCPTINQNGTTAIGIAAFEGHVSVVKLLLDAKADVNQANMVRDAFFSCQVI